jgi:hypothetical protein
MTQISTSIQQNTQPVVEPSLSDLMSLAKTDTMLNINCHHVGIIQSFDSEKQTVTAIIAYKKTIFEPDPKSGSYQPKLINYPILLDLPAVFLGNKNMGVTFPINQGDECLILFNDRDIDNWFKSGQSGPVSTPRLHSFADGFALVGVKSMNNVISSFDNNRVLLFNGSVGVGVSSSLVKVFNATDTLGSLLQQILTQLQTLANTPAVPSVPLNPTVAAQLAVLATSLSGLLE